MNCLFCWCFFFLRHKKCSDAFSSICLLSSVWHYILYSMITQLRSSWWYLFKTCSRSKKNSTILNIDLEMLWIFYKRDNSLHIFQYILSFRISKMSYKWIYEFVEFLNDLQLIDRVFLVWCLVLTDLNSKLITVTSQHARNIDLSIEEDHLVSSRLLSLRVA